MTTTQEYAERLKGQIDEWAAEIDILQEKLEKTGEKKKKDLQPHIDELKKKEKEARSELSGLMAQGGDARKELGKGVDNAAKELKKALDKAIIRFKGL